MATQKTKFTVGLFITVGISVTLVAFVWLGISRIFERGQYYTTYFDESVQGLGTNSPVKYRGVPVGRVAEISVAPDSRLIEVVLKAETDLKMDQDIVAQLKMVSITGNMFIELDRKREGEPDRSPDLKFPSKHPVIASKPGDLGELLAGVDDVLKHIMTLDLGGISDRAKQTLDSINMLIAEANIKKISAEIGSSLENINAILETERWDRILASMEKAGLSLDQAMDKVNTNLDQLQHTLIRVDGVLADNEQDIQVAINNFRSALKKADQFFSSGTALLDNTDSSLYQIRENLLDVGHNLSQTSRNLNQVLESLIENPSRFLLGRPPDPRRLED